MAFIAEQLPQAKGHVAADFAAESDANVGDVHNANQGIIEISANNPMQMPHVLGYGYDWKTKDCPGETALAQRS